MLTHVGEDMFYLLQHSLAYMELKCTMSEAYPMVSFPALLVCLFVLWTSLQDLTISAVSQVGGLIPIPKKLQSFVEFASIELVGLIFFFSPMAKDLGQVLISRLEL